MAKDHKDTMDQPSDGFVPAPKAHAAPTPDAPNLTRETIRVQEYSKHIAEGKSKDEAKKLSDKRALEMVPTPREEFRQAQEARLIAEGKLAEDAAKASEKLAAAKFD